MEKYNNEELVSKLSKLINELNNEDRVKFINEYILNNVNEDMMSFADISATLQIHNVPKYINQEEIQKFLKE
jgi:glucuronate isomerase